VSCDGINCAALGNIESDVDRIETTLRNTIDARLETLVEEVRQAKWILAVIAVKDSDTRVSELLDAARKERS